MKTFLLASVALLTVFSAVAEEEASFSLQSLARLSDEHIAQLERGAEELERNLREGKIDERKLGLAASNHEDVLIKGMDCAGCLEVYDSRRIRHEMLRRELHPYILKVSANGCDDQDDRQMWNLLTLETTGTWFLIESVFLEGENDDDRCMEMSSNCNGSGSHTISTGDCDDNAAVWGFVGGHIVSYKCFIEENDRGNPDVLLEASCSGSHSTTSLDLSSVDGSDTEPEEVYWVVLPSGGLTFP